MANNVKNKLKETFNTTPRAVRWVLLAAAFIVVLILLFLLMNKPKPAPNPVANQNREIKLVVTPKTVDFSKTKIGEKGQQRFKIGATENAIVDTVRIEQPVDGFVIKKNGCRNEPVTKSINCPVDVIWAPSDPEFSDTVTLLIDWHAAGDSRETNPQTDKIEIPVGGIGTLAKPAKPATPVVEPEPFIDEEPSDIDDDFEEDDSDVADEPVKDITDSKNILKQKPMPEPELPVKRAEKCSDFAMPGYSTSGAQIGWIKPRDGRYEFHPFSDKDCNNPTGIYNPDTGIITSIDGKGRKIGTDADHVGGTFDVSALPKLKSKPGTVAKRTSNRQYTPGGMGNLKKTFDAATGMNLIDKPAVESEVLEGSGTGESVYASRPYDRTFILRQFKPIPATIVSEVRADPSVYGCDDAGNCNGGSGIPVRATVDRNVYSDNGRTIIIPTGTLLMGYLTGELPGPYKSIGRMKINWYQFIRPDGVEFNFSGDDDSDPYSADSQGRVGVPGYGSTDYIEQMVMPMLTAIIPAAVNMIAPIADTFVNQIDLDNNTVVQSGTVRSSELAKNEVISAWNKVAQKLMVDALDNTTPPFSIAAGTRITVYSPVDLIAACGDATENPGKKCAFHKYEKNARVDWAKLKGKVKVDYNDSSWVGQVRSFNMAQYCIQEKGVWTVDQSKMGDIIAAGHDYRTALAYCQAQNYQGKTQAQYDAYYQNLTKNGAVNTSSYDSESKKVVTDYSNDEYNKKVLGLEYELDEEGNETGNIKNPFEKTKKPGEEAVGSVDCDGQAPDANGCCPGETLEDLGELGLNCCPAGGGDCFPPLDVN